MTCEALSASDAWTYLQQKDKLPSGCLINLTGRVTVVSEIFRVKKDLLFLIELENKIKIVVKQKAYLVWQEQITPEHDYVFTNLRATTLQKGSVSPSKIFIPWTKSSLHLASDTQYATVTLQDWLSSRKMNLPELDHTETCEHMIDDRHTAKFVSYQGIITNCGQANVGLYELDHRICLYVSCVPACHRFSSLTLGSKIVVYNAHRRGFAKTPKVRLFCCISSCIRIVEAIERSQSCKQMCLSSILLQPVSVYSLACTEIAALMDLPSVLAEKLSTPTSSFFPSSIVQLIPLLLSSLCCPWLQEEARNLLQEFLAVPHDCCVAKQKTSRIPTIASIGKERDDLSEKSHDLTDLQQKYYGSSFPVTELNEKLFWSTVSDSVEGSPGKILIGYLESNPVTGRLQLQDSTGSVDVVVCSSSLDVGHVCSSQCTSPKLGSALTCPVAHPALIGSIVCVRKCRAITERFLSMDVPNSYHINSKYVSKSRHVLYLMFSLTDCVLLYLSNRSQDNKTIEQDITRGHVVGTCSKQSECEETASGVPPRKKKKCDSDQSNVPKVTNVSQLVYVSHKESLMTASRNISPHLRFCVLGHLIKKPSSPSGRSGIQDIDVTSCKMRNHNSVCSSNSTSKHVHNEKENCQTTHTSQSSSAKTRGSTNGESTDVTKTQTALSKETSLIVHPPEPVVLLFQDNVQWFPVLQTDAFYRLSVDGCEEVLDALQPQLYGEKLQKVVTSSHTRMCMQVPSNTQLTRVFMEDESWLKHVDTSMLDKPEYCDIEEIQSTSCSESQISFCGKIVARSHKPQDTPSVGRNKNAKPSSRVQLANEKLGVSVLDNMSVCLQVQSLASQKEISVYMNLQNTSYPLGLLPGIGVQFHRLERKVSRIDKVYCQYTAVSTVTVFQVADTPVHRPPVSTSTAVETSNTINTGSSQHPTLPLQYIVDMWRDPNTDRLFRSSVYICHIMKLCLKSVCCGCGSVVSSVGCSSPACTDGSSYLSAKVSVLVDDGSCPAVVMFANCSELVQKLLRLSEEQWRHLEIATQDQGEVFLQQFIGEGETVLESFLIRLCNSQHVKRQCRMSLQHRVTQGARRNTWKAGVVDINNMATDEFLYHSVKASAMFETRCLPYIQLDCIDLEDVSI